MRSLLKFSVAVSATLFLATGSMAGQLVIDDSDGSITGGWDDWNNYPDSQISNQDENGTPKVEKLIVNYTDKLLTSVEVWLASGTTRQQYDSLYVNTSFTSNSYFFDWDYFAIEGTSSTDHSSDLEGDVPTGDGLYTVDSDWINNSWDDRYVITSGSSTRQNNPSAIDADFLTVFDSGFGPTESSDGYLKLIYDFSIYGVGGLELDGGFFVAYTPWCANDVVGGGLEMDPVPEPATMLLFGTGLAGLAGVARRRRK